MVRCEVFLERLDRLDTGQVLGPAMRAHASSCPACAREAARLGLALEALATAEASAERGDDPLQSRRQRLMVERVMAEIGLMPLPRQDYFAARDWIIAGSVIALSIALIPFGKDFAELMRLFGTGFSLPLALVLGLVLSSYGTYFVATHIEEVQDFVSRRTRLRKG
ncbi:MAG TPA: hypothetical protein VFL04_07910 [Rectinemataceae bacterium]|nr:hypothetical protein [Rectinemataceae bacterium]